MSRQLCMRLFIWFILATFGESAALIRSARSSEQQRQQQETFVGFQSDPNGRGTLGLILSCLLTLILCVWSALHLNVPRQGQTHRQRLLLNISWVTAGVYAPELVVFTAWRQWSSARLLSKTIETTSKVGTLPETVIQRKHPWTTIHSFFASTGGFAIDCTPWHGTLLPKDGPKRLTVTARGMDFLAKFGVLPDVPVEDIQDKSKADALAKFLVLLQATWMLIQVIGRLVVKLPVTLLEVNTVAHVLCALFMYAMWWKKPLLAKEPILISSPMLDVLLPFMFMKSSVSGKIDKAQMKSQTKIKTLLAALNLYSKIPEIEYLCFRSKTIRDCRSDENQDKVRSVARIQDVEVTEHSIDVACRNFKGQQALSKDSSVAFFERKPRVRADTSRYFEYDETILHRATSVAEALNARKLDSTRMRSHRVDETHDCWHLEAEELLCTRSRNWPNDELLRSVDGLVVGIVLWLANFIYGGIHLTAWNDHFPSSFEKWMWRSSAAYIAFCGGLWVLLNTVVRKSHHLNDFWEKWMEGEKGWVQNITLGAVVFVCGSSLVVARAYIVVEAFISIRSLPTGAYDTPEWSEVFPHL